MRKYRCSEVLQCFPAIPLKSSTTLKVNNYSGLNDSIGDRLCRARKYLDRLPPAIQGQNGSTTTFIAALKILSLGFTETETINILMDSYNPRCVPPWSEREIVKKVVDAGRVIQGRM